MRVGGDAAVAGRDVAAVAAAGLPRWRAPDARSLAWCAWDGECVVFDAATAATHLLDAPGGAVLRCLLEAGRPLGEPELLERLAQVATGTGFLSSKLRPDLPPDLPALRDVLGELARIGLARREVAP